MSPQEFINLYEKYLAGNCSPEEITLIEFYKDNFELKDLPWSTEMGDKEEIRLDILNKLNNKVAGPPKRSRPYWIAAAAAVTILAVGLIWVTTRKDQYAPVGLAKISKEVKP